MELEHTGFLIAYDVRCPRRLVRVHRFLVERAFAVQYSVFAGSGDHRWAERLAAGLSQRIDGREDDVRIYTVPRRTRMLLIDGARGASEVVLAGAEIPELVKTFLRNQDSNLI